MHRSLYQVSFHGAVTIPVGHPLMSWEVSTGNEWTGEFLIKDIRREWTHRARTCLERARHCHDTTVGLHNESLWPKERTDRGRI